MKIRIRLYRTIFAVGEVGARNVLTDFTENRVSVS